MTGWYPDPGGRPDRYRYWDGTSWSQETSSDPADPAPGAPGHRRTSTPDEHRHHSGVAFGVAALALVVVVVSTVVIIRRAADPDQFGAEVGGAPSASTGQGRSASAGPLSRPATAGAGDDSTPSAGASCPTGRPAELAPHPMDGRVHGGRLAMATVPGYSAPGPEYMLSWMSDTQGISQTTEPGWQSIFAVGELQRAGTFGTVRDAARASMACAMRTGWYLHLTGHKTVQDAPTSIDGHSAWIVTWEVYDDTPGLSVRGDRLTFVAVDDGRSDAYSMWCGMVPLGDADRTALDGTVLAGLTVGG